MSPRLGDSEKVLQRSSMAALLLALVALLLLSHCFIVVAGVHQLGQCQALRRRGLSGESAVSCTSHPG